MSTKHTPGPWYVAIDDRYSMSHIDVRHTNDSPGAASGVIAKVTCRVSWVTQQTANARLIAAAPELLEALKWYVENDDTNIGQEGNAFWEAGLDRARAAIAKATGEQA